MTEFSARIETFLARSGWEGARHTALAGDASGRRYTRFRAAKNSALLMETPAAQADSLAAFLRVADWLRSVGFSAPAILAADQSLGLLLIEDFGDALFARLMAQDPGREQALYEAAADQLADLHDHPAPAWLAPYTNADLGDLVAITAQVYAPAFGGQPDAAAGLSALVTKAADRLLDAPSVVCLRDYHAENLIWLPGRTGPARVGLLDFQDAFLGHPAYDLVSLLQDARRDVAPQVEAQMIARFCARTGHETARFGAAYALLGAQRNLRILGVFTRLALTAGKPQYLALIPRVWGHVTRNLAHPDMADLRDTVAATLPEPTPQALERIAEQCLTAIR